LINDFNENLDVAYGNTYYGDTNKTANPFIVSSLTMYNMDSVKVIEGAGVGLMEGNLDSIPGKYLIGGVYMPISLGSFPPGSGSPINPDSVYLNIIARSEVGYGGKLTLQISETESLANPNILNSTGDVWAFDTPVLTTDWQIYSIQYSKMSIGYQCNGNFIRQPELCTQANINMETSVAGGKARAYVDFYIFTYGKPFHP
jgi:hypothetical protein